MSEQEIPPGYEEMKDVETRATVLAFAIRSGRRPQIGEFCGFSASKRFGPDLPATDLVGMDYEALEEAGPKQWYCFFTTEADIKAAHLLINAQDLAFRGGSQKQGALYRGTKHIVIDNKNMGEL